MTVFETPRLTAAEVTEDDIAELLEVHLSNQAYLDLTEGSGGIAGAYDRGMLERDLMMSAMTPGRHTCVLRLRAGGACVGVLDWMDENPNDGAPWVGLVMVHAAHQRSGLAAEALHGLAEHGREQGWTRLREGVDRGERRRDGARTRCRHARGRAQASQDRRRRARPRRDGSRPVSGAYRAAR